MNFANSNAILPEGTIICIEDGNHLVSQLADFDLPNTYASGKYVIYSNRLIRAIGGITIISHAEFDSGTDFYETKAIHPETEDKIIFHYAVNR